MSAKRVFVWALCLWKWGMLSRPAGFGEETGGESLGWIKGNASWSLGCCYLTC